MQTSFITENNPTSIGKDLLAYLNTWSESDELLVAGKSLNIILCFGLDKNSDLLDNEAQKSQVAFSNNTLQLADYQSIPLKLDNFSSNQGLAFVYSSIVKNFLMSPPLKFPNVRVESLKASLRSSVAPSTFMTDKDSASMKVSLQREGDSFEDELLMLNEVIAESNVSNMNLFVLDSFVSMNKSDKLKNSATLGALIRKVFRTLISA